MIIAERVAQTLVDLGIERVYGLPGEDHMTLLDALSDVGLTYYTAANESSAVIMAAADAKVSGIPSVAILSLAPGLSNGVNGLLHAYLEESPVLVVSGQHAARKEPFVVRQGFDLGGLVDPVTKWGGRISRDSDAVLAVCKALDLATAHHSGPVYLELPDEVAKAEETAQSGAYDPVAALKQSWQDHGQARLAPAPLSSTVQDDLQGRLTAAEHPVLIVGGRRQVVSRDTVTAFAATYRCPVFTSSGQKGLVTGSDPYFAGTFLNGSLESRLVGQADLVIWIDPEAYDIYNTPWKYDAHVAAITPAAHGEWLYPFSSRIVADPELALSTLLDAGTGSSAWSQDDIRAYRQEVRQELLHDDDPGLSVPAAVEAALGASPPNARLTADAGFSKPVVAMLSEPAEFGDYLASNALSTMGFSIPAAMAAARASDTPVLAFLGDGSLLMRVTELALRRGLRAPLVVVAVMDESLSQIEIKQERLNLTNVGVTLPPLSCKALGEAVGVNGVDVDTADDLARAVKEAWADPSTPTLIGAHIDPSSSRRIFEVLRG